MKLKIKLIFIKFFSIFIINKNKRKEWRNKKKSKIIKNYLKRYLYILENKEFFKKTKKEISKKIFVLWFQKFENAPEIVKICINNLKKFKPKDYELIILDEENIKKYITIPNFIIEKRKKNIISMQHYSDIIRIFLLEKYGGIWCDSTILLVNNIPNNILKEDFFIFKCIDNIKEIYTNNWFIVSKKNNIFIKIMKNFLYEYWKNENKLVDYLFYHYFMEILINNDKLKNEYNKMFKYNDTNLYNNLSCEINDNDFKLFLSHPIHKLNHREIINKNREKTLYKKLKEKELIYYET